MDIRSELIRIIYSSVPMSLVTILINSSILSFILWGVVAHTTILIWFGLTNLCSLSRFWLYKKFQLLDVETSIPVVWEQAALFSSIVSGGLWGAASLWLFPANDIAHQVFLAFVIAGMCAGAITTLSSILKASVSFVILCLVPLAGQFLLLGTDIGNAMAVMSILFLLMILASSKNLNRTITESLLIR
ncbi:MAG: hypothetical protein KAU21_11730, partial [Gammaproteobacteria bacterium]|nr:hypothetical protein [Gammaproteobacteria bacterium]